MAELHFKRKQNSEKTIEYCDSTKKIDNNSKEKQGYLHRLHLNITHVMRTVLPRLRIHILYTYKTNNFVYPIKKKNIMSLLIFHFA